MLSALKTLTFFRNNVFSVAEENFYEKVRTVNLKFLHNFLRYIFHVGIGRLEIYDNKFDFLTILRYKFGHKNDGMWTKI